MAHRTPTSNTDPTEPLSVPVPDGDGAPAPARPGVQADPTPAASPVASAVGDPRDGDRAGAGRPRSIKGRPGPRPPWNRRRRDLPADPVTGQIDTDALWNARMRVEFTVDLADELAEFEREMDRIKAAAVQAAATYTDLHRRINAAEEASKLGYTGLAQMQAYVFVGDRLDQAEAAS